MSTKSYDRRVKYNTDEERRQAELKSKRESAKRYYQRKKQEQEELTRKIETITRERDEALARITELETIIYNSK